MVTVSAERLLRIYRQLIGNLDDPIDLPVEAAHLLSERDCFEELTLTDAEQQQLDQLDDELVKRWEVLAEVLPYPAPHPRRHALEPACQIARLRMEAGLTQTQLAELIGTKQSSIARLERGRTQPTIEFLRKLGAALGKRLEINFVPIEQ